MIKNKIKLCFLLCILIACKNKKSSVNVNYNLEQSIKKSDFLGDSSYFQLVNTINTDSSLFQASSLEYSDQDGKIYHCEALIDRKKSIHKLTSIIKDTKKEVIDEFYYLNSKKRVSSRLILDFLNETALFKQHISFFDTSETLIYKGVKTYVTLDSSEAKRYVKTDEEVDFNDRIAKDIIQQKGNFSTNFRGFAYLDMYNIDFIKVGSNDGNFNSLLAISEESELIKRLKSNESTYIGKSLIVQFIKGREPDGFSFQKLIDISLANTD